MESVDVDRLDAAFPVAASISLELISATAVSDRWEQPSALPKLSVGALACHLGRQPVLVAELLGRGNELPTLPSADEHYARAAWARSTSPDDPVNDRSQDDADAALGPAALIERVDRALETVHRMLTDGTASYVVPIPWQGWSLRRADFLLTRLLEMVVHTDDLAVSIDQPTPEFPEPAFAPVRDLLVRLAVRRHGQSAVVSTLTRSQRTWPISAF